MKKELDRGTDGKEIQKNEKTRKNIKHERHKK